MEAMRDHAHRGYDESMMISGEGKPDSLSIMSTTTPVSSALVLLTAITLVGCGDDDSNGSSGTGASGSGASGSGGSGGAGGSGADGTGGSGADGSGGAGGGTNPDPPDADCNKLSLVDMSGASMVGTDAELRAAMTAGGKVQLTADIDATGPFDVGADAVLDGGGFTVSGGDTTHLFVARMVDFTIQNAVLIDGNNQVDDSEHFARRSGAAIMANGGNGTTDGPATGSLTVIDVVFTGHQIKPEGPGDLRGGAVYVFNLPDVVVSGSTFSDNEGSNGGAIGGLGSAIKVIASSFVDNRTNITGAGTVGEGNGGAISLDAMSQNAQQAHLHICGCDFRNNQAAITGGAIYYVSHWYTDTDVIIDQSVFDGNFTTSTAQGQGGAIFAMDDDKAQISPDPNLANSLVISNSTFNGNRTWARGAGVWYWTKDGRLTLTNSTFADNVVDEANPTGMGGALAVSTGPADLLHCTFANNYSKFHGGGLQMGGEAVVSMQNCLFYNNTSNRDGGYANFQSNREVDVDSGGNMQHLDANLVIDGNSNLPVAAGAAFADPLLEPLADNGGPGWTMALGAGSPAIDAGVAGALQTDQRGLPRDASPDVGAYELQ